MPIKKNTNKLSQLYRTIDQKELSKEALDTLAKLRLATGNFRKQEGKEVDAFKLFFDRLIKNKPTAVKTTPEYKAMIKERRSENGRKAMEARKAKQESRQGQGSEEDSKRPAKPFGWRLKGKHNYRKPTREDIRTKKAYYEARINRADTNRKKFPMLERGGYMADGGVVYYVNDFYPNYDEDKIAQILKDNGFKKVRKGKKYGYSNQPVVVMFEGNKNTATDILEKEFENYISVYEKDWGRKMADGGFMAKSGNIYSSDDAYESIILKDGVEVDRVLVRGRNKGEAREMYEDLYESKMLKKHGENISYEIILAPNKMAKGGAIENQYEGRTPEDIWNAYTKNQRIHFLYDHHEDINEAKAIQSEDERPWFNEAYKSDWNVLDKVVSDRFANHVRGGQYAKGGFMEHGGEVGEYFRISEMNEKLNRMFPDSFGFSVGTTSPEGNKSVNSSALIANPNDPFRGLKDSDIDSKLFFPQYKQMHDIRFRIYQGGENTYFYFNLESEKGDEYIGQFGFKDRGDVPSSYITRFIAFLMEQYGLPFGVNHNVMADGGFMAKGGVFYSDSHKLGHE
jgi:hypothetical protein